MKTFKYMFYFSLLVAMSFMLVAHSNADNINILIPMAICVYVYVIIKFMANLCLNNAISKPCSTEWFFLTALFYDKSSDIAWPIIWIVVSIRYVIVAESYVMVLAGAALGILYLILLISKIKTFKKVYHEVLENNPMK